MKKLLMLLLALFILGETDLFAQQNFRRPAGIYAIGLRGQPPANTLVEKPFVDGVALAQEWKDLESASIPGVYNFSIIDATLAVVQRFGKKMTLAIFPFRVPAYLVNDPNVQTYKIQHVGALVTTPVPWDNTALARYEALYQALADHPVPDSSQGGVLVPFRDHPLVAGFACWPVGMNGIRDICQLSGQCPALHQTPNYTRVAFTGGILRSLHAVVDRFPKQFCYVPYFRISDQTASLSLDDHLLAALKQEFYNGVAPPRMGLFQENMSCNGPNTSGAFALFQEQNNTYTMMQALQSWIDLQPLGNAGATDPCLVTTVPGDRSTAISGPEIAIQRVYQTLGCRYFEIYQTDLLHPGFADEFQKWHDILTMPTAIADDRSAAPNEFVLQQNYPNPFNPNTVISFQLPVNSRVTLKVFDVNGREVATLVDSEMAAGEHAVTFAPQATASSLYIYKITAGKFSQTRKAVLMK